MPTSIFDRQNFETVVIQLTEKNEKNSIALILMLYFRTQAKYCAKTGTISQKLSSYMHIMGRKMNNTSDK